MNEEIWEEIEQIMQGELWLEYVPQNFLVHKTPAHKEQMQITEENFVLQKFLQEREKG